MFAWIFGNFDAPSAAILIALIGGATAVTITYVLQPSVVVTQQRYEIDLLQLKQHEAAGNRDAKYLHEREMAKVAARNAVDLAQIGTGKLIDVPARASSQEG